MSLVVLLGFSWSTTNQMFLIICVIIPQSLEFNQVRVTDTFKIIETKDILPRVVFRILDVRNYLNYLGYRFYMIIRSTETVSMTILEFKNRIQLLYKPIIIDFININHSLKTKPRSGGTTFKCNDVLNHKQISDQLNAGFPCLNKGSNELSDFCCVNDYDQHRTHFRPDLI